MDGNKPKQRVEKPIEKQSNVNLTPTKHVEIREEDLNKEYQLPDYRPKSRFTKKIASLIPRARKKKLKKIAYASKRKNRILGK